MKILLLYAGNSLNYGAFMMTANLINQINSRIKGCHFIVGANSPKDLERISKETNNARISSYEKETGIPADILYKRRSLITYKILHHNRTILKFKPDSIFVLGGDDLSEYYEKWKISFDLINLYRLSKRSKVFLVGQTIGPFYSYRKKLAFHCLKNIPIYTRDPDNTAYLKNALGLSHAIESSDLAFLDMPLQFDYIEALRDYDLVKNEYITIVPSGLVYKYTRNSDRYLSEWVKIVGAALQRHTTNKIALLAHVLYPDKVDDRKIIRAIVDKINDERLIPITDEILASKARYILGNGLLTITGRMHAAISTFQMGKPSVSLSYSVKYNGIIGMDLGFNELIIEANGDGRWGQGEISSAVDHKLDYIDNHYTDLLEDIQNRTINLKEKAMIQIHDIVKILTR